MSLTHAKNRIRQKPCVSASRETSKAWVCLKRVRLIPACQAHDTRRGHTAAVQSLRFTPGSSIAVLNPRSVGESHRSTCEKMTGQRLSYAPAGIATEVSRFEVRGF